MLQSSQTFPAVGSNDENIKKTRVGSYTIYFGPKAPRGFENNWIETMPGKSWFTILRMHSPLQSWIDQVWQPGEIELVK